MKILCTGQGTFTGDDLVIGRYYEAAEFNEPTEQQNRAFHALLQEFWVSGCHSYNAKDFDQFRDFIKRDLGAGFERFKYVEQTDQGLRWGNAKKREDIPKTAPLMAGILKSWSDYSKKQRKETIDRLISTMIQCGVDSKKFYEILKGMEEACIKS